MKSSYSNSQGNCVDVKKIGRFYVVTDTKLGDKSPRLTFTEDEWDAFLRGAKDGEFDFAAALASRVEDLPSQINDLLPQVGEIVEHAGKQYECTMVEWERGEDEITVAYRRKWVDDSPVFETSTANRWQGQAATLTILDEAALWRAKSEDDLG